MPGNDQALGREAIKTKLNFPHLPDEGSRANGNCAVSKWNSRMKGGQRLIVVLHSLRADEWMDNGYGEGLKCGPKVA